MIKLFVVAPKSSLSRVVATLHQLKVAHFVDHKKDSFELCAPLSSFDKISNLLVQARSLKAMLSLEKSAKRSTFTLSDIETDLAKLKKDLSQILEEKKKAEDSISAINGQKPILKMMQALEVSPEDFFESNYVCSFFGTIQKPITQELEELKDDILLKTAVVDNQQCIALFADRKKKDEIENILSGMQFSAIETAPTKGLEGSPQDLLSSLEKKQQDFLRQIEKANVKIASYAKKHGQNLADIEYFLTKESEKAQAPLSFGATKETFFLHCFIPKDKKDEVILHVKDATKNHVHFLEEEIENEEEVPIKLNNGSYAGNFEFFTKLYALPMYKEFDPTKLMAYTFPLFFGFMLGDVVYGLITFMLFWYLRRKLPEGKKFFNIMLAASIAAMLFGIMYGEWFGFEPYHGLIVRTHDFDTLMLIAIVAGLVQVNFGLMLGFILEYKHHGLMHALTHKASWMLLQVGGALFFGPLLGMLTVAKPLFYLGIVIFILAAAMLFKAEGFIGIMEMPSILSHIVSYARLMAVGLASVFVAVIINESATHLFHEGIMWWPLAIIILVVGHTFNIALGILSPTLHSVRLHYVEFFTKFYKGGGVEYTPFGAEKEKSLI